MLLNYEIITFCGWVFQNSKEKKKNHLIYIVASEFCSTLTLTMTKGKENIELLSHSHIIIWIWLCAILIAT